MPEPEEVPFVTGSFSTGFYLISLVFATALGFRQSAWESSRGDIYLFLLHRPLRREAIFRMKLAIGTGVFLVCASVPIVVYGSWAATSGTHAGPFEWSMTASYWQVVLLLPLVYLCAFLSGLRPARWFGTRLLPLAASLAMLFLMTLRVGVVGPWRAVDGGVGRVAGWDYLFRGENERICLKGAK